MKKICSVFMALLLMLSLGTAVPALAEEPKPLPGTGNLITNPGFEDINADGITPTAWDLGAGERWKEKRTIEAVQEAPANGKNCVRLTKSPEDNIAFYTQMMEHRFVKGEQYQVRAKTKGAASLQFKFEFLSEPSYSGKTIIGSQYTEKVPTSTGWEQFSTTFTAPQDAAAAAFVVCLYQTGTAFIDDVEVFLVGEADKVKLVTDNTFYYTEWTGDGVATVTLNENYPAYGTGKVQFFLKDGETVLKEGAAALQNGTASFAYPLSLLAEKAHEYTVEAVFCDATGKEVERHTDPVYKYDRPSMLNETGDFVVDGELFVPIAMHQMEAREFETYLSYFKEAGINTVYCGAEYLDICEKLGLKAIVYLFNNMAPAGHPDNIEWSRERLEKYSNHPALLAWKIMDEPRLNWPEPYDWLIRSYTLIKEYDNTHPVFLLEASPFKDYITESARYCDVYATDPYPGSSGDPLNLASSFVYDMMDHTVGAVDARKMVVATLQTCIWGKGDYFPKSYEFRNGVYQALWAGARGLEFYTYCINQNLKAPWIHETEIWDGVAGFNALEKDGAFGHFIEKKYPPFLSAEGEEAWYRAYVKDNAVYLIVLNRNNQDKTVDIPLNSYNGKISIQDFSAETVIGATAETKLVMGNTLSVNLPANGAILYKIKPNKTPDYSVLSFAEFEEMTAKVEEEAKTEFGDLAGYEWAEDAIVSLKNAGVIPAADTFRPGEAITRGDFAMYIVNALGLAGTAETNFPDVSAEAPYAKQVSAGYAQGLFLGDENGNFNPEASITRQELFTICHRAMLKVGKLDSTAVGEEALEGFSDKASIAAYAVEPIAALTKDGIVQGTDTGAVNPLGNTTRAESAVLIKRIVEKPIVQKEEQPVEDEKPEIILPEDNPSTKEVTERKEAVAFLQAIGVTDAKFQADAAVTRGEAAKLLVRYLGYKETMAPTNTMFSDVKADNENSGYIAAANQMGIMSGFADGTFGPDNAVTFNQLIKLLVSALGYTPHAEAAGGYTAGYLTMASRLELLKNISQSAGEEPVRGSVAALLMKNAANAEIAFPISYGEDASGEYTASDETVLTRYHNLNKHEGQITANYMTTLKPGSSRTRENEISVEGTVYTLGASAQNGAEFIGQNVVLYEKDEEIIWLAPSKNVEKLTVFGENVIKEKTTKLALFYENEEEKSYTLGIETGAVFVQNGVVKDNWTKEDLTDADILTLVSEGGRDANVIFADTFANRVVEKINKTSKTIYFKNNTKLVLDGADSGVRVQFTDAEGNLAKVEDCAAWNIISVAESTDKSTLKLILSKTSLTGKVTETSLEDVKIGEAVYKKAPAMSSLSVGDEGTFYLDYTGRIAAYDENSTAERYGYLVTASFAGGVSEVLKLKILTEESNLEVLEAADTVSLNGTGTNKKNIMDSPLLHNGVSVIPQLIRYSVNANGQIISIVTAVDGTNMTYDQQEAAFTMDYTDGGKGANYYTSGVTYLMETKYVFTEKTKIFSVPITATDDEDKYLVPKNPLTQLKHAVKYYNVQLYDCDDHEVSAMVIYEGAISDKDWTSTQYQQCKGAIVTKLTKGINEDGEAVTKVYVSDQNGEEVILFTDDPEFELILGGGTTGVITDPVKETAVTAGKINATLPISELHVGDVIGYLLDGYGQLSGAKVLFRSQSPQMMKAGIWRPLQDDYTPLGYGYGIVKKTTPRGAIVTNRTFVSDDALASYDYVEYDHYNYFDNGDREVQCYLFDKEKQTVQKIERADIEVNDWVFTMKQTTEQRLFIVYR